MLRIVVVVLLIACAVPGRAAPPDAPPAWLKDCAAQILARAAMDEARARARALGLQGPVPPPTAEDVARAQERVLKTLDELMLVSGLDPRPFREALVRYRPAPSRSEPGRPRAAGPMARSRGTCPRPASPDVRAIAVF